jgi:hypothetical protein
MLFGTCAEFPADATAEAPNAKIAIKRLSAKHVAARILGIAFSS